LLGAALCTRLWAWCCLVVLYPHGVVGELALPTEALRRPPAAHSALHRRQAHLLALDRHPAGGWGARRGRRTISVAVEPERQLVLPAGEEVRPHLEDGTRWV
jgi:hypothetical protein